MHRIGTEVGVVKIWYVIIAAFHRALHNVKIYPFLSLFLGAYSGRPVSEAGSICRIESGSETRVLQSQSGNLEWAGPRS
jgi:hypothetical protein